MKDVPKPTTKKIAKTPLVMQLESLECGAASLAMVMAYYGKWVPLEQLREDAGVSRDGASAKNIFQAAKKYGFSGKGFLRRRPKLMEAGKFPCIIHWNRAHFVVLNGFKGKKAYINDPAKGVMKVSFEEFDKSYSGVYLELSPNEDFVPGGKRKSVLSFAKKRLIGAASLIALFCITTTVFNAVGIFHPFVKEFFVNSIISGQHPDWLLPFILVVAGIGIIEIIATVVRQIFNYKLLGKLAIQSSSTFMWKILKLPISFFSQRMVGDIEKRKETNETIAATLVNLLAPLALNAIVLIVYLALMIYLSYILTLLGVTAITIDLIVSRSLAKKRTDISRVFSRDTAMLNALSSKGIDMIETIKSSGAESGYFHTWSESREAVTANRKKLANISATYGMIPALIDLIIQYGIIFLGVYYVTTGEFTIGAILAFQGIATAFMTPASALITSDQTIQEMRTDMERVDDVMEYPDDPNVVKEVSNLEDFKKCVPNVELRHITFGYNKLEEPLIKDFSLSIKAGTTVAIVGGSGCGKSTLAKLISGLYMPWEGEILFNGKSVLEIDREVFSNMVSVVDQDIVLFEDSIEDNIKMWDATLLDFEMILAAKDASIHKEIVDRGGYKCHISEGGSNFSGGERQRIEIARALANDPSILILDEATSALDAETEHAIIKAIERRGVTTIVVAHRLSTIRNADHIIVLDNGYVVEEGNHEELVARRGRYYELVSSE